MCETYKEVEDMWQLKIWESGEEQGEVKEIRKKKVK
jgi:hypothetical protein